LRWAWLLLVIGCRFGGPEGGVDAAAAIAPDAPAPDEGPPIVFPDAAGIEVPLRVDAAVCDPVANTGCAALLRCDVGEGTLTGTCVGIWVSAEGAACFKGSGTDSCAARLTCFGGTCRALCYENSDCRPGGCCNVRLPSGFRVCSACQKL
jgi:hypothetical protein